MVGLGPAPRAAPGRCRPAAERARCAGAGAQCPARARRQWSSPLGHARVQQDVVDQLSAVMRRVDVQAAAVQDAKERPSARAGRQAGRLCGARGQPGQPGCQPRAARSFADIRGRQVRLWLSRGRRCGVTRGVERYCEVCRPAIEVYSGRLRGVEEQPVCLLCSNRTACVSSRALCVVGDCQCACCAA